MSRERLRQQRIARAGRADQQDVRLRELDVVVLGLIVESLVVIVNGDREHLLGMVLADHIVIEDLADFLRRRDAVARFYQPGLVVLADNVHAQLDAFVANVDSCAGNELAQLVLALAAEGAIERVRGITAAGLAHLKTLLDARRRSRYPQATCCGEAFRHQGGYTRICQEGINITRAGKRAKRREMDQGRHPRN